MCLSVRVERCIIQNGSEARPAVGLLFFALQHVMIQDRDHTGRDLTSRDAELGSFDLETGPTGWKGREGGETWRCGHGKSAFLDHARMIAPENDLIQFTWLERSEDPPDRSGPSHP